MYILVSSHVQNLDVTSTTFRISTYRDTILHYSASNETGNSLSGRALCLCQYAHMSAGSRYSGEIGSLSHLIFLVFWVADYMLPFMVRQVRQEMKIHTVTMFAGAGKVQMSILKALVMLHFTRGLRRGVVLASLMMKPYVYLARKRKLLLCLAFPGSRYRNAVEILENFIYKPMTSAYIEYVVTVTMWFLRLSTSHAFG